MDSKKVYKKLGTWFWWILTALPLICYFIWFILEISNLNTQGGTPLAITDITTIFNTNSIKEFLNSSFMNDMMEIIPNPIKNAMYSLTNELNINYNYAIANLLAWGIGIQFYHVIFDIMVWLPHKMHEIME